MAEVRGVATRRTDELTGISAQEASELGAVDSIFYAHYFFPKAFRQESPEFHAEVWGALEDPRHRYTSIKIFRDGAKTTLLRAFCSKRVSYGISRTILFIGKSEGAAVKSVHWLKRAILYNSRWAQTFGLEKGDKWSDDQIDIYHRVLGIHIRILGMGITGSTRGINIDDYRPDLIIVDDPCDEENTATPEQRAKITNLFFGAIRQSLSPATDSPEAKMVLLQTPLDGEDLIELCDKDGEWFSLSYSCFTEDGTESTWEARYPYKTLREEKDHFIRRGQLSIWMREKEVTITSTELSFFKEEWLQFWDVLPEGGFTYIGIDPTPPPKDIAKVSSTLHKRDDAVILAIKVFRGHVYLLEYYCAKSPNPAEFVSKFFEIALRWRPISVGCETTVFQRMLKWYIEEEMVKRQTFFTILPIEDKRKKETRILQTVSDRASNRTIHVHKNHTEFVEQFSKYPQIPHDDILDAFSIAVSCINPILASDALEGEFEVLDESNYKALDTWRGAP